MRQSYNASPLAIHGRDGRDEQRKTVAAIMAATKPLRASARPTMRYNEVTRRYEEIR